MPRYNVEYKGKYACFSSISDAFITEFMGKATYEEWRKDVYGSDCIPMEYANKMSIGEALYSLNLNKKTSAAINNLIEAGLSKEESTQLIRKPCSLCKHAFGDSAAEICIDCNGVNLEVEKCQEK